MIGIVILNYITWEDTVRCVKSIKESIKEPALKYKIYVVDNASSNTNKEEVEGILLRYNVEIIYNKINNGYAAGNNVGIRKALEDGCSKILISNSDIVFKNESIETMSNFLEKNRKVGIVGPKIYTATGEIQPINMVIKMDLIGKYLHISRKTLFKKAAIKFNNRFTRDTNNLKEPFEVYAVSGCCFMISSRCIEQIGLFDENTFLYEEEMIIGNKMEKNNLKTIYLTKSEVVHNHGSTTKNLKAFAYRCFVESEIYYCKKYLESKVIYILPLYIMRTGKYFYLSIKNNDYRKHISQYLNITLRKLFFT